MNKSTIIVQAVKETTYDVNRVATQTWANVATLSGFVLPENGDIVQKLYGIDKQVTNRFIYKGQCDYLVQDNRLVSEGKTFDIVFVADYKKALDVKLRLVVVSCQ